MWLHENQHFVAILRCPRKILLAYLHICGATIFLLRLVWLITSHLVTIFWSSSGMASSYIRTVDFQGRMDA